MIWIYWLVFFSRGLNLPKRPPCQALWAGTAAPAPGSSPMVPSLRPETASSRAASSAGLRRTDPGTASLSARSWTRTAATAFGWTSSGKPSHHEFQLATIRANTTSTTRPLHALWTLTWSTTTRKSATKVSKGRPAPPCGEEETAEWWKSLIKRNLNYYRFFPLFFFFFYRHFLSSF